MPLQCKSSRKLIASYRRAIYKTDTENEFSVQKNHSIQIFSKNRQNYRFSPKQNFTEAKQENPKAKFQLTTQAKIAQAKQENAQRPKQKSPNYRGVDYDYFI